MNYYITNVSATVSLTLHRYNYNDLGLSHKITHTVLIATLYDIMIVWLNP